MCVRVRGPIVYQLLRSLYTKREQAMPERNTNHRRYIPHLLFQMTVHSDTVVSSIDRSFQQLIQFYAASILYKMNKMM